MTAGDTDVEIASVDRLRKREIENLEGKGNNEGKSLSPLSPDPFKEAEHTDIEGDTDHKTLLSPGCHRAVTSKPTCNEVGKKSPRFLSTTGANMMTPDCGLVEGQSTAIRSRRVTYKVEACV